LIINSIDVLILIRLWLRICYWSDCNYLQ